MAKQLASVPEESTTGFTAPFRPPNTYRDRIWSVPVLGAPIRWTIFPFSQSGSGHNGSSYSSSGASNSWQSNNSASSGGTARDIAGNDELRKIAHQMVIDGYAQRMVEEFVTASPAPALKFGGSPDHALKNWFSELDVDWVLQIHDEQGLRRLFRDKPATTQDLVEKWIRALTVIVASITQLVFAFHSPPSVALFGKASITEMLGVVDVIITVLEAERLRAVLDMFTCVCGASHMITPVMISREGQSIFNEIGGSLQRGRNLLWGIILNTMKEVRTLVEEDDSWAIEISRGGGEVHKNTRFIVDCIVSMKDARTSMQNSAPSDNTEHLGGLIDDTIDYLKGLLFTKSESCSDQSLRYLFLLNNSYFVANVVSESSFIGELWDLEPELTPECKKYMDSYLDLSWGHVLSCIPKSSFPGPLRRWINTSSLVKFESAFHQTYQAQKFWKIPHPELRDALRRAIIDRIISGYRGYLEEHPELEKYVGRESSSPEDLKQMLWELFEG